ncbi:MAG: leucine-rich repeat domain-containing protein [Clostridia bacterium]|nr:leucine-rich repeat domain-containing protein [Clostridia bacterium]
MKKKLLLTLLVVMVFTCLFAISIGAAGSTENTYGDVTTIEGEGAPTTPSVISATARAVVLSSDGTCYTIPSYYLIKDDAHFTWSPNSLVVSQLGLNSGSDVRKNVVRMEIPEGIKTSVKTSSGGSKFEDATKLIEASIPTTMELMGEYFFNRCSALTTVSGVENSKIEKIYRNTFNGTKITSISLPSNITAIDAYAFGGTSITSIAIPASVTYIGGYAFASSGLETITFEKRTLAYDEEGNLTNGLDMGEYAAFENCKSLTALVLPEGLTKIGNCFAKNCSALASITLPSTLSALDGSQQFYGTALTEVIGLENTKLTYLSSEMFRSVRTWKPDVIRLPNTCTTLYGYALADVGMKTLYLGASFEKFEGDNPITGCSSLKTIYAPATATTIPLGNSGTTTVYLTTTDETAISAIKTSTGITQVVSLADYTADPSKYTSGKWIITGYNLCDAFYAGKHNTEGVVGVNQFKGDKYVTDYICVSGCNRNCGMQAETKLCGPLFTNKGYSKIADGTMFTYGVVINEENIAKYVATGKTFNYGVIIGAANFDDKGNLIETNAIIDNTGKALINNSIVVDFSNVELENFTIYNVKMQGIETEAQRNLPIYCCAYIIDGDAVSYMGNEVTENAKTISSSAITVIETTTTTPPVADDDQNA